MNRKDILEYVKTKYDTIPETPWEDYPENIVLRHLNGKKWYGLLMKPTLKQLGLENNDKRIDVINLKIDPVWSFELTKNKSIIPAYHMNKTHWITVLLDGKVSDEQLKDLIDYSYQLTAPKRKSRIKSEE